MYKQTKLVICKANDIINVCVYQQGELIEQYQEQFENKRLEGNIYYGKVTNIVKGMQSAFINIGTNKNALIHIHDLIQKDENIAENEKNCDISKLIKPNQNIIVQIKRDCNNNKGPRVTKDVKLAGKYIILMPHSTFITVSKKINDEEERKRLIEIVTSHMKDKNQEYGTIVRTSAEGKNAELIKKDLEDLVKKWNEILEKSKNAEPPVELYNNNGIIGKLINDFEPMGLEIITNDNEIYEFIKGIDNECNVTVDTELNVEVNKNRKIYLNCGGFITIDETEALTAIDVNSGKFTGKDNLEETIVKVNLEAATEIAKQIRLRDLGGIIVIDFIDMSKSESIEKVRNRMQEEIKKDRSKIQILEFTKLGLLEITRKHILGK